MQNSTYYTSECRVILSHFCSGTAKKLASQNSLAYKNEKWLYISRNEGNMDLFEGFSKFAMLLVGLVAAVIVIAAIVSAFCGNFIGLLIIGLVLVFSVKSKK